MIIVGILNENIINSQVFAKPLVNFFNHFVRSMYIFAAISVGIPLITNSPSLKRSRYIHGKPYILVKD